ncbi:MAG: hypothetical protein HY906_09490 [Deltaproteobacteria bacterium]|nr:hypothetical protein [Deltaproteobacteria bacterium]
MRLADADADRFFAVLRPLLAFVNEQRRIVPRPVPRADGCLVAQDAAPILDVLWADDSLRDVFIAENPAQLDAEALALARSWDRRRKGTFFVWKHYRKHTLFLADDQGFAVLGLYSTFAEMLPGPLPVLVDAVLLPFGDRIISDGLIHMKNMTFGPGIRENLRYRKRQLVANGAIRSSLLPSPKPVPNPRSARPRGRRP